MQDEPTQGFIDVRALLNWSGALAGLLLIIAGSLLYPAVPGWDPRIGLSSVELSISAQVPALLLTALLCGPRAAFIASVAYLIFGLFILPVFHGGGGLEYLQQPAFGYIAGFLPAAWLSGRLAQQEGLDTLEGLTGAAVLGLVTIQLCGALNLLLGSLAGRWEPSLNQLLLTYSLLPLPGQLLLCCLVGVLARLLRPLLLVDH